MPGPAAILVAHGSPNQTLPGPPGADDIGSFGRPGLGLRDVRSWAFGRNNLCVDTRVETMGVNPRAWPWLPVAPVALRRERNDGRISNLPCDALRSTVTGWIDLLLASATAALGYGIGLRSAWIFRSPSTPKKY